MNIFFQNVVQNAALLMDHWLLLLAASSWMILTWRRKALRLATILCCWNAVFTVIYQCCSCTLVNSWIFRYGVLFISWSSRWMWLWKNMFAWWKVCSRTCSGSVTRLLNLSDTLIVSKLPGIPWWVISMSHACFRKDLRASYQQWFCSELSLTTVWPRLTTVNREIPLKWIEWYLLRFRITWESSTKIWLKRFNWSK